MNIKLASFYKSDGIWELKNSKKGKLRSIKVYFTWKQSQRLLRFGLLTFPFCYQFLSTRYFSSRAFTCFLLGSPGDVIPISPQLTPNSPQLSPSSPQWSPSIPKWSPSGPPVVPSGLQWSPNGPPMVPQWSPNGPPKCRIGPLKYLRCPPKLPHRSPKVPQMSPKTAP